MAAHSEERKGEWYIFSASLLFGFFPIVIVFTYATISSFASLAWSTLFAAVTFSIVMSFRKRWHELKNLTLWKLCLFITFFIGVLFYGLYFLGIEHSTPGNVAIIGLFQVFTSFLFFNLYRKEFISSEHIFGSALMILGAFTILARNFSGLNIGDFFILAATFITPFGNHFQQEARKIASSETIMFLRSTLTAVIFFVFIYTVGTPANYSDLYTALPFLLISGVLLLGFEKMLWIEGIHRISVTKAVALGSVAPFFTLIFSWLLLQQIPTIWQLVSLPLFVAGVLLLTDQVKFKQSTVSLK